MRTIFKSDMEITERDQSGFPLKMQCAHSRVSYNSPFSGPCMACGERIFFFDNPKYTMRSWMDNITRKS